MNAGRTLLTFVCVDYGGTLVVGVPRERGVFPGRYPWRCFNCQENWPDVRTGAPAKVARRSNPHRKKDE